jgi:hypothetical protein
MCKFEYTSLFVPSQKINNDFSLKTSPQTVTYRSIFKQMFLALLEYEEWRLLGCYAMWLL